MLGLGILSDTIMRQTIFSILVLLASDSSQAFWGWQSGSQNDPQQGRGAAQSEGNADGQANMTGEFDFWFKFRAQGQGDLRGQGRPEAYGSPYGYPYVPAPNYWGYPQAPYHYPQPYSAPQ